MNYSSQPCRGLADPGPGAAHAVAGAASARMAQRQASAALQNGHPAPRREQTPNIWIARTCHAAAGFRRERMVCPPDRYIVSIALETAAVWICDGQQSDRHVSMAAGAGFIASPGRETVIATDGPSDFLHLTVLGAFLDRQCEAAGVDARRSRDIGGLVVADPLVEHIGRVLVGGPAGWHASYAEILGQLLIARLLTLLPRGAPLTPLPTWRLRKVQAFVETQIAAPLRLRDLADSAGLSRMHFAAQFRAATGFRPHDYVLMRRIERAKILIARGTMAMVEIALDVGFQSQAHFCTIFKRVTGMTPTQWRDALGDPASARVPSGKRRGADMAAPAVH